MSGVNCNEKPWVSSKWIIQNVGGRSIRTRELFWIYLLCDILLYLGGFTDSAFRRGKVECLMIPISTFFRAVVTHGQFILIEIDLGEAAVSDGVKRDLNSLSKSWTWVAWMRTRNPSHQTSKGYRQEAIFPWIFASNEKHIYHRGKKYKCRYKVYYYSYSIVNGRAHRKTVCLDGIEARQRCTIRERVWMSP